MQLFLSMLRVPGSTRSIRPHSRLSSEFSYTNLEPRSLMCAGPATVDISEAPNPSETRQHSSSTADAPVSRIVNGSLTNQFPSVGLIGDNTGFFCSGTLISSRYVLTAAHCAEGVSGTAGRFQLGSQIYSTSQVFVHPGYNSNLIGQDNAHDIAIYKLDRDVVGIAPSPINRLTPAVGQLLTLVGFGAGGTGNSGHDGSFGTKRVGTTPIDHVSSKLISWNFDNNSESNTAPGDSGGPAFLQLNGTYFVAGVTSGGDRANAGLGDRSFDTRVDAFASWIDSVIGNSAGQSVVSISPVDNIGGETSAGQVANPASFAVSRTGPLDKALTVTLVSAGTATKGSDYFLLPSAVTIPAGASSTTITVRPIDDTLSEGDEIVAVSLVAGTGYQVDSTKNNAVLTIRDNDVPLWNNHFTNRFQLNGGSVTATGSNANATRENGEPNVLGTSGGKSIWWSWTAPASGSVTISTAGSNFDTTLGVYTGTSVNALTLVRTNDDQNWRAGIYTSRLDFQAVAGQKYQILVDGYRGDSGLVKLTVNQFSGRASGPFSTLDRADRSANASQRGNRDSDQSVRMGLRSSDTVATSNASFGPARQFVPTRTQLYAFSTFNRATGPVRELDAALIDAGIWNVAGESSLTELRIEF